MKFIAPGMLAAFHGTLKEAIGEPKYKLWFEGHTVLRMDGDSLAIGVVNRFFRDWLDKHFRTALESSAKKTFGPNTVVRFRIQPELFQEQKKRESERSSPMPAGQAAPAKPTVRRRPNRFRWDRFVVGPTNRVAHSAIGALVADPRSGYSPLLIFGGTGLGKTHLLQALAAECEARHPQINVVLTSGEEFTNEFLDALRNHRINSFRKRMRSADLLIVDDVPFVAGKKATQDEFLHTIRALEVRGSRVVLASQIHPRKIEGLHGDLKSRLTSGMAARLDPLDRDVRRQIIVDKSVAAKLQLPAEVLDYLADRLKSTVSQIEGVVHFLDHYFATFRSAITPESVRRALAEVIRQEKPSYRVEDVKQRACDFFGFSPKLLRAKGRSRDISQARTFVMYLARKYTSATLSEIGRVIAGVNHSSVIAAQRRAEKELARDGEIVLGDRSWKIRDALEAFERELGCA